MIGDIIEIQRAKRTTFEMLEASPSRVTGDSAAPASEGDAQHAAFAELMAALRDKLGRFKIRLD
jgi:hypothetical protein